jgi:hypothetical protein
MSLIIPRGPVTIKRDQLAKVHIPDPTATSAPLPHLDLLEIVEQGFEACDLEIGDRAYELGHDGKRFFGLLEVRCGEVKPSSAWVVGLSNSYDQPFCASLVAGARVSVSDNLSFSGNLKLEPAGDGTLCEHLAGQIPGIVLLLKKYWMRYEYRVSQYQSSGMNDVAAHDLIIRAVDAGACPNRLIPTVLGHWRVPDYEQFQARTAWSLFNAFTQALKGNLFELPSRTERLHQLFDARVGIKTYPKGKDGG